MSLCQLGAAEAAEQIRSGAITSVELVEACLARIDEREETVQAWAYLDREFALKQAEDRHTARQIGEPTGPMHGVPVGVKDIFDTRDMPTEDGTPLHACRRPYNDCTAVTLLREAGAVIMGKTVTTELAVYAPGKTRNPHNPEHTPGGSSSGSAAAVADGMVPLAIGTQTNGSIIRPASFCGVFGFKPSHGFISRVGVLRQSTPLDHVGVFARSIEDAALITQCLMRYDENDTDMRPRATANFVATATQEPPLRPNLGFVRSPAWDDADDDTKEAFTELCEHLGDAVQEMELPSVFGDALDLHRTIMEADLAKNLAKEYESGRDKLSDTLCEMIERGQKVLAVDYNRAVDRQASLNMALGEIFERVDAILTPAALAEAPRGLESTGSPVFCTIWTLCGTPAITLPLLEGSSGLPMGVQLVGRKGDDARLLRTAQWLVTDAMANAEGKA